MSLRYDRNLYMLAFEHRASFQKGLLGIEGTPSSEDEADEAAAAGASR
jgi:hypothetical protein